jgi:DoxX-like family
MSAHIARWLSLWAAVGLSTIMLLAIGFHLRRHESPLAPGILFLLAVFVVLGRFRIGGKQGAKRCPRGNAKDRDRSLEEFRLEPPGQKGAQIADSCS